MHTAQESGFFFFSGFVVAHYSVLLFFGILDVASRTLLEWDLSNTMTSDSVTRVLKRAVARHVKPEIINSDQGSQVTSDDWVSAIKSLETVRISMDGKGRALDNVYIDRFFRTLKYEKLYIQPSSSPNELRKACKEFIYYYNYRRDHSSIGNKPSMSVYRRAA